MAELLLLTRSLNFGGAERQLTVLASQLYRRGISMSVAAFYGDGPFRAVLESSGVEVQSLGKRSRWDLVRFSVRLIRMVRDARPAVIYSFLPGPNIAALMMKLVTPRSNIAWAVRSSEMDSAQRDWLGRLVAGVENIGAPLTAVIICNSQAARRYAIARGFPKEKVKVVYNGIDTRRFEPRETTRCVVRNEWGIRDEHVVVGLVARLHPMKDHATFLRAAAIASEARPNLRFVCVGDGPRSYTEQLRALSDSLGLRIRVLWAGARPDVEAVYNAFDIATLTSTSEGFPNVVGEAMACGVPCVVTDAGDAPEIVGDTGIVVPKGDPDQLATGWGRMLDAVHQDRSGLSERVRTRIVERFSLDRMVDRTLEVLGMSVAQGHDL